MPPAGGDWELRCVRCLPYLLGIQGPRGFLGVEFCLVLAKLPPNVAVPLVLKENHRTRWDKVLHAVLIIRYSLIRRLTGCFAVLFSHRLFRRELRDCGVCQGWDFKPRYSRRVAMKVFEHLQQF